MLDHLLKAVMEVPDGSVSDLLDALFGVLGDYSPELSKPMAAFIKDVVINCFTRYQRSYDLVNWKGLVDSVNDKGTKAQLYLGLHAVPPQFVPPSLADAIAKGLESTPFGAEASARSPSDRNRRRESPCGQLTGMSARRLSGSMPLLYQSGFRVESPEDVRRWVRETGQELNAAGSVTATFVIDESGWVRIADRRSEHVLAPVEDRCRPAGEMTFTIGPRSVSVTWVTNQSTGYCPEPDSWPAVQAALARSDIPGLEGFSKEFLFRRCPRCGSINIIKEGIFDCGVCAHHCRKNGTWTPMPPEQGARKRGYSRLGGKRRHRTSSLEARPQGHAGYLTSKRVHDVEITRKTGTSWIFSG